MNESVGKSGFESKLCKICKEVQLLRMKHCYECGRCVATFDHHCFWISNCVGEKNKPIFYLCLLSNLVSIVNAGRLLIAAMWQRGEKFAHQIVFLSFLLILFTGLGALFVVHSYFMCTNMTTWETISWKTIYYLAGRSYGHGSPFSRGVCQNIKDYWLLTFKKDYKGWALIPLPQA